MTTITARSILRTGCRRAASRRGAFRAFALGFAALAAFSSPEIALSQPVAAPPPTTPPTDPSQPAPVPTPPDAPPREQVTIDQLDPLLRVGIRAEFLRQNQKAIPTVVIVSDAGSYLRAIAAWEPLARFPILIDDGTPAAREDIARFVRGFEPAQVIRWQAPDAPALDTAAQKQAAVEDVLRAVWAYGTQEVPTIADAVRATCGTDCPGVVVAGAFDPAWTAGVALAAGRGQPVVWVDARQNVSDAFSREEGETFAAGVEHAIAALGVPFTAIGDSIDAVALCLNTPVRTSSLRAGEWIATTDRVGRASDRRDDPTRWAWASQVHGTEAQAAYRAMSAMFLDMDAAWLFDTYNLGQPWESYSLKGAQGVLSAEGTRPTQITAYPLNGLVEWRQALKDPIDAPLIMVNTHGMRNVFELRNGTASCGDVPMLNQPVAVSFIHSWSAYQPGDRNTVAGRWFERGAFAYCGSVQEPYLAAFQTPTQLSMRLASLVPWAAACRLDGAPAWRIALFGDPLLTLGQPQVRSEDPLPLEGGEALDEAMRTALRAGDFGAAVECLVILGRDEDTARLVERLRSEQNDAVTPGMAATALPALYRAGRFALVQSLYPTLDDGDAADPANRDILWLSCRTHLPEHGTVMSLLRGNIRPEQATADTADLAIIASATGERSAAIDMLTTYRRSLTDAAQVRLIDNAMSMLRGR